MIWILDPTFWLWYLKFSVVVPLVSLLPLSEEFCCFRKSKLDVWTWVTSYACLPAYLWSVLYSTCFLASFPLGWVGVNIIVIIIMLSLELLFICQEYFKLRTIMLLPGVCARVFCVTLTLQETTCLGEVISRLHFEFFSNKRYCC